MGGPLALGIVALGLLSATPASASTVETCHSTSDPSVKRVCFRTAPGVAAAVSIEPYTDSTGLRYRFTTAADALTAGGSCVADGATITCPGGPYQRVSFYGDALGDQLDASALPVEAYQGGLSAYMDAKGGDDILTGSAAADQLYGGDGNDRINGASGADTISAGAGDDVITFSGTAVVNGGSGRDVVTFAGITARVAVTLGAVGGDGAWPTYGSIGASVEDIFGGEGDDTLLSTLNLSNAFAGGGGNDRMNPGSGIDVVDGGTGDDFITVRDSSVDTVGCGPGYDTVVVDRTDVYAPDCEKVSFEGLDTDRDRSLVPEDCNDNDRRIRPGARDIPQDGVDQDCDGIDAPFPSLGSRVALSFNGLRVSSLLVTSLRRGTRIEVRCRARPCPFKKRVQTFRSARAKVQLSSWFKKRQLRRGTVIETRVMAAEYLGFRRSDRIGRTKVTTTYRCVAPRRRSQPVGQLVSSMPSTPRKGLECG